MEQNSLYDRPDLYDLMAPREPILERFYVEIASERGGRVLDLACGSGRLTIPLAQAGLEVVGGDLSPEMLDRARKNAKAQAVELDLIQLDMRDFDLGGRTFDTIIVAMNSILHLHSLDDLKGFFGSVGRHLSPKGRLVFDAFLPNIAILNSDPNKRELIGAVVHDGLGAITVEETASYDPLTQIRHVDWYWSSETEMDFWQAALPMRCIFPQEMPLLVASGGLRVIARFGDFDRRPLTAGSMRQVCVCGLTPVP
ncbi:class I SAM-dependent methyltransferase [Bradyrhizobium sp. 180]|uniref:class I SAM-dependent methyltransferase n=1 Tax=unclassified Bradyrhizobium TaxID=2631580 RepID=UPI001FFB748E|nr:MULTISPECIES: class I SAM-dependent methyltransferase [unclassified Bradyrhizobium]MCK1423694.1 class I SAM-dependent methyltransferase [Bradyrhizobium sp. CW12]MCK1491108.1 class I SAM-dependent methyltransferase [Bradyrhizobium sp. 180]MCK1529268.1 class I SAM-dependent methyltransferase [Bradyrhizobium sp. 182]MCK1596458.1 class I SAM-dependent methyltransferase [Bradyrhizobium sp. 164]MCK1620478.1 class I SAM-dependent methyltransferase [Bradyrhizobium sp. 159]